MKKLTLISVLCASGIFGGTSALAAANEGSFQINTTLTATCEVTSSAQVLSFAYTAFSTAAVPGTGSPSIAFKCSRNLAPVSVVFDTVDANSTSAGIGVVAGLQYSLAIGAVSVGSPGTAATSASIGAPKLISYAISGSMPLGQAGDVTATTTQIRTILLSY